LHGASDRAQVHAKRTDLRAVDHAEKWSAAMGAALEPVLQRGHWTQRVRSSSSG
jgi:hypothetical protein